MATIEKKSLDASDEVRTPAKTRIEGVSLHGSQIGRLRFEPGWKWSECIKPVVHTEKCEALHRGYVLEGTLHISHQDGTELDLEPGDAYTIEPGHDAWVVGDKPFVGLEFETTTVEHYAEGAP